ncbi:MAG: MauE/DoxX family redox-associated membrane protein [Thermoguttaceae bacterium]
MGNRIIRFFIALVLIFAAITKAHMLSTSPSLPVSGWFGLLEARWVQIVTAEFEILWALLLISNPFPRIIWAGTTILFVAFSVVSSARWLLNENSCNCFGKLEVYPLYTAIFDAAIVGTLLWFRKRAAQNAGNPARKCVIAVLVWLAVGLSVFLAVNSVQNNELAEIGTEFIGADGRKTILLEPEKWVGKEFPLLAYIENDAELLKQGEWTIIVGKPNCAECEKLLNTAISKGAERLAFLEFVEHEVDTVGGDTKPQVSFRAGLKVQNENIIMTPFAVRCSNGACLEVTLAGG